MIWSPNRQSEGFGRLQFIISNILGVIAVVRTLVIAVALIASISGVFNQAFSKTHGEPNDSAKLTSSDLATADGSCRAALRNGKVYCLLTGTRVDIELVPDTWSDDSEATNWNKWLVDFDNDLFSQWVESDSGDGQETVYVRISNAKTVEAKGRFLPATKSGAADPAESQRKFESIIQQSLERTLKNAGKMPSTKNPLKEVRFAITFMRDDKVVPRYGKRDLGIAAIVVPSTGDLTVYGRIKDGRSPGIQAMSDVGHGNIDVIENEEFLRRCDAIDSQQSAGTVR
jgi:hypothetical protein